MATTECVVQRATGYTVMSNHHLRDKRLGLKAKGLLSVILSLPDDWDYSIGGLAVICDTGKDAIRAAIRELEKAGYISRKRLKGEGGQFGGNQYIIREIPVEVDAPSSDFPTMEKPTQDFPTSENPTEIITDQVITDESIPPVSPEKAGAAKKVGRPKKCNTKLDDTQMEALIRQNVATLGEASGWSRDDKNAVYKLVMEFYAPRDVGGAPPRHTARGVNGLFRKLSDFGGTAQAVRGLLNEAIERGWTSVYPERVQGRSGTAPVRDEEGGCYVRL